MRFKIYKTYMKNYSMLVVTYVRGLRKKLTVLRLKSTDRFEVTGRGTVFTFEKGAIPKGTYSRHITGNPIIIDGKPYLATGVETFVAYQNKDLNSMNVGILVKELS